MLHRALPQITMLHTVISQCCTILFHLAESGTMLNIIAQLFPIRHVTPIGTLLQQIAPWYTMLFNVTPCGHMLHKVPVYCTMILFAPNNYD